MVKYKNPKDIHMSKLASKYKGPYIVLKSFVASLLVYPLSLASQEILDKKGNLSQVLRLKGSIVSVEDCKIYRGQVPPVPRIDQELIRNFFKELGLIKGKGRQVARPLTTADSEGESDSDFIQCESEGEWESEDDTLAYATPPEYADINDGLEHGYEFGQYNGSGDASAVQYVEAEDVEYDSDAAEADSERGSALPPAPAPSLVHDSDLEQGDEGDEEEAVFGRTRAETRRLRADRDERAAIRPRATSQNMGDVDVQSLEPRGTAMREAAREYLDAFNDRERTRGQDDAMERVREAAASQSNEAGEQREAGV
jgi:hypothetical protein